MVEIRVGPQSIVYSLSLVITREDAKDMLEDIDHLAMPSGATKELLGALTEIMHGTKRKPI